jgi:hypothetical protein
MNRSNAGRPAHLPTEKSCTEVETLAAFGIPHDDIARLLRIDPKTLRKHYAEQLELGSIKATAKVAQNLFTIACKPNREGLQAAIFWLRMRAGWSEHSPSERSFPGAKLLGKKEERQQAAESLTGIYAPPAPPLGFRN